jgi:Na+-translocating ferredoxin:NAD+ oxidoreductase RnfC subunit
LSTDREDRRRGPSDHWQIKDAVIYAPCRCLRACPEHLCPTKIAHAVKSNRMDLAVKYHVTACIECGCCT